MDRRKEIVNEYKQKKTAGGIYRVTNSRNGRFLLGHTHDITAMQNRFDFSVANGSCVHLRMKEDWAEFGGKAFTFEILESIAIKESQSRDEFIDDLEKLEEIWRGKIDASKAY